MVGVINISKFVDSITHFEPSLVCRGLWYHVTYPRKGNLHLLSLLLRALAAADRALAFELITQVYVFPLYFFVFEISVQVIKLIFYLLH